MTASARDTKITERESVHIPVMMPEALEALALRPGMSVVDATLGGGSYTRALLQEVLPGGKVVAFDWDREAIERFQDRAKGTPFQDVMLVEAPYSEVEQCLREFGITEVDAMVADLGLSSDQIAEKERGLSFLEDGPLDMRLNSRETVTAAQILKEWSEESLESLLDVYGDEPEARKIAKAIVKAREEKPLERTTELAYLVKGAVHFKRRFGRIHPATQTFQALRIAVNSERRHLESFLPQAIALLKKGGRLVVVSFHSGEDGLVKHFFQRMAKEGTVRILTKKPLIASDKEISYNPRSRSAKLRCVEKIT